MYRIIPMNRPLAMALWLSTALLLSACSDSQQTDGKSDSSKSVDNSGQGNGKAAAVKSTKIAEPRADDEKEAVAVLVKAKADLTFDEAGHVITASFQKVKIPEKALAQLPTLKMLKRLRLDGFDRKFDGDKEPQIQDGDLQFIEGLTQLRYLNLGHNYITDEGLKRLAGLTKLEYLYLNHTGITSKGLKLLKGLRNLEYLYLNDTEITDGGLVHLRALSKLKQLDLRNNSITDEGLDYLKGLPALKRIALIGCSDVTDQGVRALKAAISEDVYVVYLFQSDEPDGNDP